MAELGPSLRRLTQSDGGTLQVWRGQIDPKRDMVSTETTVRYAICSTPRCGSEMLGCLLTRTGVLGSPAEFFNPKRFPEWRSRASAEEAEDVIEFIERRRTTPNGCFGVKLHYEHLTNAIALLGCRQLLDNYRFILLRRCDVLGQAISWVRADQTKAWYSAIQELAPPHYDRTAIFNRLNSIVKQTGNWQHFLAETGKRSLELSYEDIVEKPADAVAKVTEFLRIGLGQTISRSNDLPAMPEVQRTNINDEWRRRFVDEMQQFHLDLADQGKWHHGFYEEPFLIALKRFARSRLRAAHRSRWFHTGRRPLP